MSSQSYHLVKQPLLIFNILMLTSINLIPLLVNVPVFIQLSVNSVTCVFIGCVIGCKVILKKDEKESRLARIKGDDEETMSAKDAAMFPIYGSCVLFGLYLLVKNFNKDMVSYLLSFYFAFLGQMALITLLEKYLVPSSIEQLKSNVLIDKKYKLPLISEPIHLYVNQLRIICFAITVPLASTYFMTKHYFLNNIFGIAFSIIGIESLSLPNFKVGYILMWGLFFYDIFWVFGTDVMVTVAKNIDAPIKLLFPINLAVDPPTFSMLGLGDIVIPGVFVAMALKYDIDRTKHQNIGQLSTPYFNYCFLSYIAAIITVFIVMIVFKHPQPALLFLVPFCTISVLIYAYLNKDVSNMFGWEEQPKETQENQSKQS